MQFIANGPDLPEDLLLAHEEGRVVFFCGAGISYRAGLPSFKGLVEKIYELCNEVREPLEEVAFQKGQYDTTLNLLEQRYLGGRFAVRKHLAKALQLDLQREGAMKNHIALLQLARTRGSREMQSALRLVTTNFDSLFDEAARSLDTKTTSYLAPFMPIPKNTRWDGVVYLHGKLPENETEASLNQLVLSSGDFGLAYLIERWAARFVSELLRNYVVCFIGYSLNDPVMRYMMDALAADRQLGVTTQNAYAFGECDQGQESTKAKEWEVKGVIPILYQVPESNDHQALYQTLLAWAATYHDSILGKESIVTSLAHQKPSSSTAQDDFVGRMLWAISDDSGSPARRFAQCEPLPSLDWLDVFFENHFSAKDFSRFGIYQKIKPITAEEKTKYSFSLLRRPAPFEYGSSMALVTEWYPNCRWDRVMEALADWLVGHLNEPRLILRLSRDGGELHDGLARRIEAKLNDNPDAIFDDRLRIYWRLFLTGKVKSRGRSLDLHDWKRRLKRDGLTASIRLELRGLLSPKIELERAFNWTEYGENRLVPETAKSAISCDLKLASDDVSLLRRVPDEPCWIEALPKLLPEFQQLLIDALDLLHEVGKANEEEDPSYFDLPSISEHWQNRDYQDWVELIRLLRDAWVAIQKSDAPRALRIAQVWFDLPYPTFKRAALFAACHGDGFAPELWVEWLTSKDAWWLWENSFRREVLRLLVLQGSKLSVDSLDKLETAILTGPPRARNHPHLEDTDWKKDVEYGIWLRLSKLQAGGRALGLAATQRLNVISGLHPQWILATNESDEFPYWSSGTGDPDYEVQGQILHAPRKRTDLVAWLKSPPPVQNPFRDKDTWPEVCRTRLYHSLFALRDLASEGTWPADRWGAALQTWCDEKMIQLSWKFAAPCIYAMPEADFRKVVYGVGIWLKAVSKTRTEHDTLFLQLCQRTIDLSPSNSIEDAYAVMAAFSHPIGHTTEALLNFAFKDKPQDNAYLPPSIKPIFTSFCEPTRPHFFYGRVILTTRLLALYRLDPTWTKNYLLPFFDWSGQPVEARAAWQGFLWSPRANMNLLQEFKSDFLTVAQHYEMLGDVKTQYAQFLTYTALNKIECYSQTEFKFALNALPPKGLEEAAHALMQALESSGDQCEVFWRNRVKPFLLEAWPNSTNKLSRKISESFARLCISARDEFPAALLVLKDRLKPLDHPHMPMHQLVKSGLPSRFPVETLAFLDAILRELPWPLPELDVCLNTIKQANPSLSRDPKFTRLSDFARRHG